MIQKVSKSQVVKVVPTKSTIIYEYPGDSNAGSMAIADIKGRYPRQGLVLNKECTEFAYILDGNGYLFTSNKKIVCKQGDLLIISPKEPFAWQGDLKVLIFCTPPYDNAKHIKA